MASGTEPGQVAEGSLLGAKQRRGKGAALGRVSSCHWVVIQGPNGEVAHTRQPLSSLPAWECRTAGNQAIPRVWDHNLAGAALRPPGESPPLALTSGEFWASEHLVLVKGLD